MAAANQDNRNFVTIVQVVDVLFGRGTGCYKHEGNIRFFRLIQERRDEYKATRSREVKQTIARQVYERVHEHGGRFLKLADSEVPVAHIARNGLWEEVSERAALGKIAHTLRENKGVERSSSSGTDTETSHVDIETQNSSKIECPSPSNREGLGNRQDNIVSGMVTRSSVGSASQYDTLLPGGSPLMPVDNQASSWECGPQGNLSRAAAQVQIVLPHPNESNTMRPPSAPQPSSFQTAKVDHQQRAIHQQAPWNTTFQYLNQKILPGPRYDSMVAGPALPPHKMGRSFPPPRTASCTNLGNFPNGCALSLPPASVAMTQGQESQGALSETDRVFDDGLKVGTYDSARDGNVTEKDAASFLLSSFLRDIEGLQRVTEEQLQAEQASLPEEEKRLVHSDLFGRLCSVGMTNTASTSIDAIVQEMRQEIDRLPVVRKRALVEAQSICDESEEFSNDRLEAFLRHEDMNPKLGAERFVQYWEDRREVFGPIRFLSRMTLNDSLTSEDKAALESGAFRLLPCLDSSGRQIFLFHWARDTKEGYTTENMIRALWYLMEVAAREFKEYNGMVRLIWGKDVTLFEADIKLMLCMDQYAMRCWPITIRADHFCYMHSIITTTMKPVMMAVKSRRMRSRSIFHDGPESNVLTELSIYGIHPNMVPPEMGGTLELS